MARGTKKQHFVPQLLLRQFADQNERIYCYDIAADRSFPTIVRDTGHQNHFLSIPALDGAEGPGAHFEQVFQSVEGPAVDSIRSIDAALASGILRVVGAPERDALSRFIAVQYLRTPAMREQMFQHVELMRRVLATETMARNGFDPAVPAITSLIDRISQIPKDKEAALHGEHILQPAFIAELATMFAGHVWLLGVNRTGSPLYVADNPVAIHGHVERPGRGLGPATYGAETTIPLSSVLQLSLFERKFIEDETGVQDQDGSVFAELSLDNVLFQRSLQVFSARQFIYCEQDDFADAKRFCDADPELRDPLRSKVEAVAFGRVERPRRRER